MAGLRRENRGLIARYLCDEISFPFALKIPMQPLRKFLVLSLAARDKASAKREANSSAHTTRTRKSVRQE